MARASDAALISASSNASKVSPDALFNGLITLVAALLGAFAGALAAYAFQRYQLRRQDRREALEAAHHLMFCLFQQTNAVVLIQRDYVWPEKSNPARFIAIPATQAFDTSRYTFTAHEVATIFDTHGGRELLYELFVAQDAYTVALDAWNLRSALHRSEVQPKLAASTIRNGSMVTTREMKDALGPLTFPSICNATLAAQESLQRALTKLEKGTRGCLEYLKSSKRFKGEMFIYADLSERFGIDEPIAPLAAMEDAEVPRYGAWMDHYAIKSFSVSVPERNV